MGKITTKKLTIMRHHVEFFTVIGLLVLLLFPFPVFIKKSVIVPIALIVDIVSVMDYIYLSYYMDGKDLTDKFLLFGSTLIVMLYLIISALAVFVNTRPNMIVFATIFLSLYAFTIYLTHKFYHRINQIEEEVIDETSSTSNSAS